MAISYRACEAQQEMLLPASLQHWLPRGHLAYFISDTVDALDLSAFYARYAGGGARNQPFHPAMMVKVLIYGYATGCFSSRKIEHIGISNATGKAEQRLRTGSAEGSSTRIRASRRPWASSRQVCDRSQAAVSALASGLTLT